MCFFYYETLLFCYLNNQNKKNDNGFRSVFSSVIGFILKFGPILDLNKFSRSRGILKADY